MLNQQGIVDNYYFFLHFLLTYTRNKRHTVRQVEVVHEETN